MPCQQTSFNVRGMWYLHRNTYTRVLGVVSHGVLPQRNGHRGHADRRAAMAAAILPADVDDELPDVLDGLVIFLPVLVEGFRELLGINVAVHRARLVVLDGN